MREKITHLQERQKELELKMKNQFEETIKKQVEERLAIIFFRM